METSAYKNQLPGVEGEITLNKNLRVHLIPTPSQHMYIEVVHGFIIMWGSEELGDNSSMSSEVMCYQT